MLNSCGLLIFLVLLIIAICIYKKHYSGFCLYDKPVYYPEYYGLKARLYNPRCTAYCSDPNSECVVWCN